MHAWPLFELTLRTPRLVLRLPSDAELDVLARRSAGRVLAPAEMDFMTFGWTQLPSPEYERGFLQYHWRTRAEWTPQAWNLNLIAFDGTEPVGGFGLMADAFAERRAVATGSWLLPEWRGRGLGREGRAALLALAFGELGAEIASSSAHEDNRASLGVSDALGYERTGVEQETGPSGRSVRMVQVQLTRERWATSTRPSVEVTGCGDACRELFGSASASLRGAGRS
jgi:RimJ/RimL family protein N-acetyltransferase